MKHTSLLLAAILSLGFACSKGGPAPDIGAYEYIPFIPTTVLVR